MYNILIVEFSTIRAWGSGTLQPLVAEMSVSKQLWKMTLVEKKCAHTFPLVSKDEEKANKQKTLKISPVFFFLFFFFYLLTSWQISVEHLYANWLLFLWSLLLQSIVWPLELAECEERHALCYLSDIQFHWYEAVRWANLSCDVSALCCQCPLSSEGPLSSLSRQESSCDDDSKREKERKQEGGREMESGNDRQLWVEVSITVGGSKNIKI